MKACAFPLTHKCWLLGYISPAVYITTPEWRWCCLAEGSGVNSGSGCVGCGSWRRRMWCHTLVPCTCAGAEGAQFCSEPWMCPCCCKPSGRRGRWWVWRSCWPAARDWPHWDSTHHNSRSHRCPPGGAPPRCTHLSPRKKSDHFLWCLGPTPPRPPPDPLRSLRICSSETRGPYGLFPWR